MFSQTIQLWKALGEHLHCRAGEEGHGTWDKQEEKEKAKKKECPNTGIGARDYEGREGMHTPGCCIDSTRLSAYRSPKQGAR